LPDRPFTTLDNQDRLTVGGEIILTNAVGTIIDLPAIMGTANSCIDSQTRRVLLWLEDLDSHKVRQASMAHAIRTIAAQLNEKELDPYLGETTLHQAIKLYQEVTGAKLASPVYDQFIRPQPQKSIELDYQQLTDYLGFSLELDRAKEILEELGCQVSIKLKSKRAPHAKLLVKPPSHRPDLQISVDLIEEIARIYGYQNIPSALMTGSLPLNPPANIDFALEHRIKQFLADIGWQEIYSLSLVSEQLAENSNYPLSDHLKLINPLLTENSFLRRSLFPSLKEAHEANPQQDSLSLFEIAAVYQPQSYNLPKEIMKLGMLSNKPYRQVRGDIEALLGQLFIVNVEISPIETKNSDNQEAEIRVFDSDSTGNKTPFQRLGKLQILKSNLIAVELDIRDLTCQAKKHPAYQPLAHTTPVIEDLTFTLLLDTRVGEVMKAIRESNQLIKKVELIDHFQQNYTFRIHYQLDHENLSTQDILPIRQKVVEMVEKKTDSKLVGKV
ncbi:MAG TPA: phenylalanine--tRNA ligase beta subunit-related protein, partial [Candidatus Woesebacteria bacterium]|nr:phenylalanine--tRNA ligase beta subunit-related protein [Candidatus Woesebacteria bacterium]